MKHFFLGGEGGHSSRPPYEIAPEERGCYSPSTPLVMKVTSIVYNPPFQKFLDPPMHRYQTIELTSHWLDSVR